MNTLRKSKSLTRLNLEIECQKKIKCIYCEEVVYPAERLAYDGNMWHRQCFRCDNCDVRLTLSTQFSLAGKVYCKNCNSKLISQYSGKIQQSRPSKSSRSSTECDIFAPDRHSNPAPESIRKKFDSSLSSKVSEEETSISLHDEHEHVDVIGALVSYDDSDVEISSSPTTSVPVHCPTSVPVHCPTSVPVHCPTSVPVHCSTSVPVNCPILRDTTNNMIKTNEAEQLQGQHAITEPKAVHFKEPEHQTLDHSIVDIPLPPADKIKNGNSEKMSVSNEDLSISEEQEYRDQADQSCTIVKVDKAPHNEKTCSRSSTSDTERIDDPFDINCKDSPKGEEIGSGSDTLDAKARGTTEEAFEDHELDSSKKRRMMLSGFVGKEPIPQIPDVDDRPFSERSQRRSYHGSYLSRSQ